MAFELNELQMMIFKNQYHDPERNNSTHQGSVKIKGVEYWVNCWVKEGKNGKFFSCSLQEKEEQPAPVESSQKNFDDDIPF